MISNSVTKGKSHYHLGNFSEFCIFIEGERSMICGKTLRLLDVMCKNNFYEVKSC